jgi:hypothetical protein
MQRLVDVYADTRVPEEVAFVLRQLTVASLGLSRLVRTQLFANPPEPERDELLDEISSVAEEVHQRMVPEGQVICPNCRQDTTLLTLSRVAATCNLSGQPTLTFAFRRNGALVGIPEYQDELERCHGKDFADRQVIPRPDEPDQAPIPLDDLADISPLEPTTSDPQPSESSADFSSSIPSSPDPSANSVSSVVNPSSIPAGQDTQPQPSLRNQRLFQRRFRATTPARNRILTPNPTTGLSGGQGKDDSPSPDSYQQNHPP